MDRHRIAVIIPALNESRTVGAVVANAARYGRAVVVDDGSGDDTGAQAAAAGAEVVRHSVNRGYDGALDSGFARAAALGCEYAITMDADGQHNPDILDRFIAALDAGADVVIGRRDRRQRLAEHVFAWVAAAKWGIADPLCGMKGYRMETYRALGHFDCCGSIGTELALHAARAGRTVVQLDVNTRDRSDAPRFDSRFSANKRILWALWRGLFPPVHADTGQHGPV